MRLAAAVALLTGTIASGAEPGCSAADQAKVAAEARVTLEKVLRTDAGVAKLFLVVHGVSRDRAECALRWQFSARGETQMIHFEARSVAGWQVTASSGMDVLLGDVVDERNAHELLRGFGRSATRLSFRFGGIAAPWEQVSPMSPTELWRTGSRK
jgi:hypothetical protein